MTVVFIAHAGLDDLTSLRELWRKIPLDRSVEVGYWSVPRDQIPTDPGETTTWLFEEWAKVNAWIAEQSATVEGGILDD